ncbi:class II aldolase/adducin family protein [Brucellaceae bacterium C25G]
MKSRWNEADAAAISNGKTGADYDLAMRVYTSRLIGADPDLVLHGGGNTSAKSVVHKDGEDVPVIFIKGSGWDLGTIEAPGLPAVWLNALLEKRHISSLDDREMVAFLRANLLDDKAPTPSVEALLHAFLPAKFVDHTHATASLVIANQPDAAEIAQQLFGDRLAIVPYVMPGFDLSIAGAQAFDNAKAGCQGLFLVNHGIFSIGDDARTAYELMIEFNSICEDYLASRGVVVPAPEQSSPTDDIAMHFEEKLRQALHATGGIFSEKVAVDFRSTPSILALSNLDNVAEVTKRGTATPDHVIRIKPFPMIANANASEKDLVELLADYAEDYKAYFERNAPLSSETKIMLDTLPRLIIVPGLGLFGLGSDAKAAGIAADLGEQTARIILAAEKIGRFNPIKEQELFEMEYWSLEQAKLKVAKPA